MEFVAWWAVLWVLVAGVGPDPAPTGDPPAQPEAAAEGAPVTAESAASQDGPFDLKLRASTLNAYSPTFILLDAQLEGGSDSDLRLACPKLQWKLTGVKEIETLRRGAYTQDDQFWDRAALISPGSPSPTKERRKLSTITRRPRKCGETDSGEPLARIFHHELNLTEPGNYWIQAVLVGADGLELQSSELRIRVLPGLRDP